MNEAINRISAILLFGLCACGADAGPAPSTGSSSAVTEADAGAGSQRGCDGPSLLAARCAGCHSAEAPAANLDLASANIRERLTDAKASAACSDFVLIDSLDPAQSLIYQQVTDDPPCAPRMPLGAQLSEDEQACLLNWLTEG